VEKSIAWGVREALWGEAVTATAAAGVRVATRGDGDRRRRRANGMREGSTLEETGNWERCEA